MYNKCIPVYFFGKFKRKEDVVMMFTPTEKGQGLVEYALILVLVAMVVLVALAALGPLISNVFDQY
jgi:pilus assembly protein Flp/PilA